MYKVIVIFLLTFPVQESAHGIKSSCSSLRAKNTSLSSGFYLIDPDGLGSNVPFQVYCDMRGMNGVGVTIVGHDSENRTLVNGFEEPGSHKRVVAYHGARMNQLKQLIDISTDCGQFLRYECHGAMLFAEGWWVSRDGEKENYWGGAKPGSGKCACGMNGTCADPSRGCNCDKNDLKWREDSGTLTKKTDLPVAELRFGDTGDDNEMAYYTLGKLWCTGILYGVSARVLARWVNGLYYKGEIVNATSERYHIHFDDGDEIWLDFSDPLAVIPDQIPEEEELSTGSRVISNKISGRPDKFFPGTIVGVVLKSSESRLYKVRLGPALISFVAIEQLRILPSNSACDGAVAELEGTRGVFVSPYFPNPYPGNSHCAWRISVPEGYRVWLTFTAFDLETSHYCQYDVVTVRDGSSFLSPPLHKLCNKHAPPVLSIGRNLFVAFVSDGETSLTGFRAVFEARPVRSCDDHPIGVVDRYVISDAMMTSSSEEREPDLTAREGRMNGPYAWCPLTREDQWLQVDLGHLEYVCAVATQGRVYRTGSGKWTRMYKLAFSTDGTIWKTLQDGHNDKVFIGNYDPITVVKQPLPQKIEARFVRFLPVEFYGWPCLRVEIYVQKSCLSKPVGVFSRKMISDTMMTSSSDYREPDLTAREGRLNGPYAWCPLKQDGDHWLQVDLGKVEFICGVAIQGKSWGADEWTTVFQLALSLDGKAWNIYKENGNDRFFQGNWDTDTVVESSLRRKQQARFVRFVPSSYRVWPCMRVEVFAEHACYNNSVQLFSERSFSLSSDLSSQYSSKYGGYNSSGVWCPKSNLSSEWLQVDLRALYYVCAVSANGTSSVYDGALTTKYKIAGSMDGKVWEIFKFESKEKYFPTEFPLGSNMTGERKLSLGYLWPTRYVRFFPVNFTKWPCLKVKVYGEIVPPPAIITPLKSTIFKLGSTIVLKCLASGYPEPAYSWTRNGSAVISGARLNEENTTLVIKDATYKDEGLVECTARNILGSVTTRGYIKIQDCISAPIGIWSEEIVSSTQMTASSSYHKIFHEPNYGRLNGLGAWCPSKLSGHHWLQVDFGTSRRLCGVATQGYMSPFNNEYTTQYTISVSPNSKTWSTYKENNVTKLFDGNKDTSSIVTQHFAHITAARYIRFHPVAYHQFPCLRVEVYAEKEPVIIGSGQTSVIVKRGSNANLTCLADGFPAPRYNWTRITSSSERLVKSTSSSELIITNVQFEDSGRYRCTATNEISSESMDFLLTVHGKPYFISTLPGQTLAIRGQSVTLHCTAVSSPTALVTWHMYKDGKKVSLSGSANLKVSTAGSPALQSNLTIVSALYQDSGTYNCVFANVIGMISADGQLQVHGPPTFIIKPMDKAVTEGETVILDCKAAGIPRPITVWKYDQQPVSSKDVLSNGSLVLKTVTTKMNHQGRYTCEAINDVGVARATVMLTIHELPYFTIWPHEHIETPKAQKVELKCTAQGRPKPTLVWTKDGIKITSRALFYNHSSAVLIISAASPEDTGTYACVAQNAAGRIITYSNITVFGNPVIDTHLTVRQVFARVGHQVGLACHAKESGIPVKYHWTKEGRRLEHSLNRTIFQNVMIIIPNKKQDFGVYMCHASNSAGMSNFSIEVIEVKRQEAVVQEGGGDRQPRKWHQFNVHLVVPLLIVMVVLLGCIVALYLRYKKLQRARRPSDIQLSLLGSEIEHGDGKGSQLTHL